MIKITGITFTDGNAICTRTVDKAINKKDLEAYRERLKLVIGRRVGTEGLSVFFMYRD